MRRQGTLRRQGALVLIVCLFYALQAGIILFSVTLAPFTPIRDVDFALAIMHLILLAVIDMGIMRKLLTTLRRIGAGYANQASARAEQALDYYRLQFEREEQLVQQISAAIEDELQKAREAVAAGNAQQVDSHLQASLDAASRLQPRLCDNITVAAVLQGKHRQCEEAGVGFEVNVAVPVDLPLPDLEIASVFFNLIDNALQECEALIAQNANAQPCISVRAFVRAGQLLVEVTNPCLSGAGVRQRKASQTLDPTQPHGWGTRIVSVIVHKLGGITRFEEHDGTFVASVMIPLT